MDLEWLNQLAGVPSRERVSEELTQAQRDKIPDSDFIFPDRKKDGGGWPIDTLAHAKAALAMARSNFRTKSKSEAEKIEKAVLKKWPELKGKEESDMSWVDRIADRHGYGELEERDESDPWARDYQTLDEEGEGVEGAIKGLKAGMHMLRERADYLWDILEKEQGFDVRRRMGRLIENIKHTEESVYGFIDTFDTKNDKSKENMKESVERRRRIAARRRRG